MAASAPCPRGTATRMGAPPGLLPASSSSNGPTARATRYDGRGGVGAKLTRVRSPWSVLDCTGELDRATSPRGTTSVSCQGTLNPGSSKQGNSRRAPSGSNWVKAYHCPSVCWANPPLVSSRRSRAFQRSRNTARPAGSAPGSPCGVKATVSGSTARATRGRGGRPAATSVALSIVTSCAFRYRVPPADDRSRSISPSPVTDSRAGSMSSVSR